MNKPLLIFSILLLLVSCHRRSADGICCTDERDYGHIGPVESSAFITIPIIMHTDSELAPDIIENVNVYLEELGLMMRLDSTIYYEPEFYLEDIVQNGVKENQLAKNEVEGHLNIFVVPNKEDLQGYLPTPVNAEFLGEQKYQRMFIYTEDEITIIHEFGHWGGLGHTFECRNIMGYDCFRDTLYTFQMDSLKSFITKHRKDFIE